jgi:hypothetical protein
VNVTITGTLVGQQTLTGVWLNTGSADVSSINLDPLLPDTGPDPSSFAAINTTPSNTESGFRSAKDLKPAGATFAQVGGYNIQLRFPNSGATSSFQGTEVANFNIVANLTSGLTANSFFTRAAPNQGGSPNAPPYALISLTNADGSTGTAGSGIAYIAAVPEPHSLLILLLGIVALGVRAAAGHRQTSH